MGGGHAERGHRGFHRLHRSRAELVAEREPHLAQLKPEATAVEEYLSELRA